MTIEAPSEIEARLQIEAVYGQPLERVAPDERPSPDYALAVPESLPSGFEVKELTSHDYQQLQAAMAKQPTSMEVPILKRDWHVLLQAKPLSERLVAVPNFPDDDEEQIASFAKHGWVVKRKVDRIEEWRRHQSTTTPAVRLKNLLVDLIEPLTVLEAHEIFETRTADPSTIEARRALHQIAVRTNGAICMGHEAHLNKGMPPGISISSGWGTVRTENPNTLAERVQAWLDSELSSNLIKSLSREEYGERHGVLVFDRLEPELETVRRDPRGYLPTDSIHLPAPITHVWCILGPVVLRYSAEGWERRDRVVGP